MAENTSTADTQAVNAESTQTSQADQGANSQNKDTTQPNSELEALKAEIANLRKESASYRTKAKQEADAKEQAERAALAEQGKFKELAEQAEARNKELETRLAQREHADLVRKVASKHSLPEALAARLRGETEAELEADAKDLAKLIPVATAPGTRRDPTPVGPGDIGEMDKIKARMRQQYGSL